MVIVELLLLMKVTTTMYDSMMKEMILIVFGGVMRVLGRDWLDE